MTAPPDHDDDELHGYRGLIPVLESFDKPLLAAVNGLALGIGATILPHCDIVWIAEGARLKVPFVTLGVTTEAAGSLLLPQRMGWQAAVALHLHGRLDERGGGGRVRSGVEGAARPISCSTRSWRRRARSGPCRSTRSRRPSASWSPPVPMPSAPHASARTPSSCGWSAAKPTKQALSDFFS